NGAPAGTLPLAISPAVRIGSVADGQMPPDTKAALVKAANADQAVARPAPVVKGLTVSGQVRNYQPVTDEMLRHPDPADWLIVRGNYQAWNNSPLAQITPQNVNRLQLAWVWAM